jgi:beta-glucosidase
MRSIRSAVLPALCCVLAVSSFAQQTYLNPALSPKQRADDLVGRLTLEEKILQMQTDAPAIPRLDLPAYYYWNEGLHGIARSGHATVFPQAIGLAAAWDTKLHHQIATTIGTEARAKYNQAVREGNHSIYYGLTLWSPNINIFRDPRWGRGQETYGEDPYLTGRLGVAFVTGLQGADPAHPMVVGTPKHFAVHSGPESERHRFNVDPSPKDLEETYLPAFRATIVEGHAGSIMCAYNAIDGTPACANHALLENTLRGAWQFKGFVTSDCGAVDDIDSKIGHHFAPDNEHASALAVKAGTDTTCGTEYADLGKAVKDGLITEAELDVSLKRLFVARFELGTIHPEASDARLQVPFSINNSAEHRQLALQAARESIVLLKNQDDFLPLKKSVKTVLVIGPNAASLAALEGNYNGVPSAPVLPVDGLERGLAGRAKVLYAQGSSYADAFPVTAPRTLFHPSKSSSSYGLRGEYFNSANFAGKPVLVRDDAQIDFDWNAAAPAKGVDAKAFSVRWSGTMTAPEPGDVPFEVDLAQCYPCGDRETVRVLLDGKVVSERSLSGIHGRDSHLSKFVLHLADTQAHAFVMEYSHEAPLFGAGITLLWQPPAEALRKQAVDLAKQADAVVAFVGLSPQLEGEEMPVKIPGFSGGDRTDIGLPEAQKQLLEAVAATGKPVVVVLMSGSAVASAWAKDHAAALLEAWYPGEEGGAAIAETLLGENNPAGRLPVTFYASVKQLPAFDDYSMRNRTYRYFTGEPLYPFGFGLSYTRFEYSNVKLSSAQIAAGGMIAVEADVRNTGVIAGDEVAELYVTPPAGDDAPLRTLEGFERIHLKAGELRHVRLELSPRQLSTVSADGVRSMRAGSYGLYLGGAQPVQGAEPALMLEITGEQRLPK